MPIKVRCPHCDTPHNLADNLAGKKIKCKNCGDAVRVPQPEPAAVGATAATAAPPGKSGAAGKPLAPPGAIRDDEDQPRPARPPARSPALRALCKKVCRAR